MFHAHMQMSLTAAVVTKKKRFSSGAVVRVEKSANFLRKNNFCLPNIVRTVHEVCLNPIVGRVSGKHFYSEVKTSIFERPGVTLSG